MDYSYYCWLTNITIANAVESHEVYRCSLTIRQDGTYKLFAYIGNLNEVQYHRPFYSHILKEEWIKDGLDEGNTRMATYLPDDAVFVLRLRREIKVDKVSLQCNSMSVNISFN